MVLALAKHHFSDQITMRLAERVAYIGVRETLTGVWW